MAKKIEASKPYTGWATATFTAEYRKKQLKKLDFLVYDKEKLIFRDKIDLEKKQNLFSLIKSIFELSSKLITVLYNVVKILILIERFKMDQNKIDSLKGIVRAILAILGILGIQLNIEPEVAVTILLGIYSIFEFAIGLFSGKPKQQ